MKEYIKFNKINHYNKCIIMTLDNKSNKDVLAPDGEKLYSICIIPIKNIESLLSSNGFEVNNDNLKKSIYIFSYYLENDYFLDSITYNGTEVEYLEIKSGYTKVLIEDEGFIMIPEEKLYEISFNQENNESSWFGGEPELLQNENYHFSDDYRFLAQINGQDLPNELKDIFYLSDAIGYIFLKKDLTDGLFFVQNT